MDTANIDRSDIPDEVLQQTTKCPHAFSCLKPRRCSAFEPCLVEHVAGQCTLFLKDRTSLACPYRMSSGERQVCRCPVHIYVQKLKRSEPPTDDRSAQRLDPADNHEASPRPGSGRGYSPGSRDGFTPSSACRSAATTTVCCQARA